MDSPVSCINRGGTRLAGRDGGKRKDSRVDEDGCETGCETAARAKENGNGKAAIGVGWKMNEVNDNHSNFYPKHC